MILHDFVTVDLPVDDVRKALVNATALLAESASTAYEHGEGLRMRVGPGGSRSGFAKTVEVTTGAVIVKDDTVTVPLMWEVTGAGSIFPRLDASLEIAPLSADLTQITLFGRYDPPLGRIGERLDRLVLHRLAENTIRAFLADVAERVATDSPAGADGDDVGSSPSESPSPGTE